jgi:hypothetical protein
VVARFARPLFLLVGLFVGSLAESVDQRVGPPCVSRRHSMVLFFFFCTEKTRQYITTQVVKVKVFSSSKSHVNNFLAAPIALTS